MYSVALAIDVSRSIGSHTGKCVVASVAILVAALQEIGVDSVTILTFGDRITLVKPESAPMDAVSVAALLSCLRFDEARTCDAEAINYAVDLLAASGTRGPKSIFVFTDGYSSSGIQLSHALYQAEEQGIDVVALSVGLEKSQLRQCYRRWATVALPSALPHALRALFEQDSGTPSKVRHGDDVPYATPSQP